MLYASTPRDLLICVAQAGLVQAKWTIDTVYGVGTTLLGPANFSPMAEFRMSRKTGVVGKSRAYPALLLHICNMLLD